MKSTLQHHRFIAAAFVLLLGVVLSCRKGGMEELPFPETEDEVLESIQLTAYVDLRAQAILNDLLAESTDKDIKEISEELKAIPGIISADAYPEEDIIVLKQRDGIQINVFVDSFRQAIENGEGMEEAAVASTRSTGSINDLPAVVSGDGQTGKALLLAPLYSEDIAYLGRKYGAEGRQYAENLYRNMINALAESGYEVLPLVDKNAAFEMFQPEIFSEYDVVVIVSEGKKHALVGPHNKWTAVIRTGTKVPTPESDILGDWNKLNYHEWLVPWLTEEWTQLYYELHLRSSIGMIYGGTYYYLSSLLFEDKDLSAFNDPWILIGAEDSADNPDLYEAFFSAGAGAFTGLDDDLDRDDILYLTSQMVTTMSTGLELDTANEWAKETAKTFKGKQVSGRKHLKSFHHIEGTPYYLYDSTPYDLSHHLEDNKTFSLYFKTHPSLAERQYEVLVDGKSIQTGKVSTTPDMTTQVTYYPESRGSYKWSVLTSIISGSGSVLASFQSGVDELNVESVSPLRISPSNLDFYPVQLGDKSDPLVIEIQNLGEKPIRVESIQHSEDAPFTVSYDESGMDIKPGGALQVSVTFCPIGLGERTDEIRIRSGEETFVVPVSGRCVYDKPVMQVDDCWGHPYTSLDFGEVEIGKSLTIDVGLTNLSPVRLVARVESSPSGFQVGLSGFSLLPGWFSRTQLTFTPTEEKDYSGSITFEFANGFDSFSFPVQGRGIKKTTGEDVVSLVTQELQFNNVEIGKKVPLNFSLTNDGGLPVTVLGIRCPIGFETGFYDGITIAPHSTLTYPVFFVPAKEQHYFGFVNIETDASEKELSFYVEGYGVKPANPKGPSMRLSTGSIDFGDVELGHSRIRDVQITNVGDTDLHVQSVITPGWIHPYPQELTLPAGETRSLQFQFIPSELEEYEGLIKITSDAISGVEYINYIGFGVDKNVPVSSVTLDRTNLVMYRGEVANLKATVLPVNASNKYLIWGTLDSLVASVDQDGRVEALTKGKTKIVVLTEDGRCQSICEVTVIDSPGSHEGTGEENWN